MQICKNASARIESEGIVREKEGYMALSESSEDVDPYEITGVCVIDASRDTGPLTAERDAPTIIETPSFVHFSVAAIAILANDLESANSIDRFIADCSIDEVFGTSGESLFPM